MSRAESPPPWPWNIQLPHGQASMSDVEWIAFIERQIRDIESLPPSLAKCSLAECRRALLQLRRYHHACGDLQCMRWPGRLT
jgi:hypothetical protein